MNHILHVSKQVSHKNDLEIPGVTLEKRDDYEEDRRTNQNERAASLERIAECSREQAHKARIDRQRELYFHRMAFHPATPAEMSPPLGCRARGPAQVAEKTFACWTYPTRRRFGMKFANRLAGNSRDGWDGRRRFCDWRH